MLALALATFFNLLDFGHGQSGGEIFSRMDGGMGGSAMGGGSRRMMSGNGVNQGSNQAGLPPGYGKSLISAFLHF